MRILSRSDFGRLEWQSEPTQQVDRGMLFVNLQLQPSDPTGKDGLLEGRTINYPSALAKVEPGNTDSTCIRWPVPQP